MKRPADTVLASAARSARLGGMSSEEALRIVALEFGAVMNDHGRVDGWAKPADERAVRKVCKPRAKQEPKQEGKDGDK